MKWSACEKGTTRGQQDRRWGKRGKGGLRDARVWVGGVGQDGDSENVVIGGLF